MSKEIKNLNEAGFYRLDYPSDLRNAVSKSMRSWRQFCDLPFGVKKLFPYSKEAAGVGYELKDGSGNKGDRKENFDLTIGDQDWLHTQAESIGNVVILELIKDLTDLVKKIKPVAVAFARGSEETFGMNGFAREVADGEDRFFIRFAHYFGKVGVGDEIGTAHIDQSGFTLHLFESGPGLQCLTNDLRWIDMPVSEGQTVIIPDVQMQLRSKNLLNARWHRVIAVPETINPDSGEVGRYSAVCFVQFKDTPKYDKETHGRLQEMEPGFNYEMPLEEYSKLFKR